MWIAGRQAWDIMLPVKTFTRRKKVDKEHKIKEDIRVQRTVDMFKNKDGHTLTSL